MKITNSDLVMLPYTYEIGDELDGEELLKQEVDELNAKSYNYAKNRAIPNLDRWIIEPFAEAFKKEAYEEAKMAVGLDLDGILKEQYEYERTLGSIEIEAKLEPKVTYFYKNILADFESFINDAVNDSNKGVRRNGVRKVDNEPYIFIDYLLDEMNRYHEDDDNKNISNDIKLEIKDPKTNEKLPFDEKIEEMLIYFDDRCSVITEKNALDFYKAMSLKKRIKKLIKDYKDHQIEINVPKEGLEKNLYYSYKLSDESVYSQLFFSRESTQYGKVYNKLMKEPKEDITESIGDLQILKELAFEEPYTNVGKKSAIHVRTESRGRSGKEGIMTIARTYDQDKTVTEDIREYSLFRVDDRIYVKAEDILTILGNLLEGHVSRTPQFRAEFFPALPPYLKQETATLT